MKILLVVVLSILLNTPIFEQTQRKSKKIMFTKFGLKGQISQRLRVM